MVITLNTRRVKAVHRLDSNPNKPANSREIYRLAVDRPLIHVVLVPNLLVFTSFYAQQRHRRIGEEEEERKGFVTYIRTNICQVSRPPGGCYLGDIYEITRVHDRGDGLVPQIQSNIAVKVDDYVIHRDSSWRGAFVSRELLDGDWPCVFRFFLLSFFLFLLLFFQLLELIFTSNLVWNRRRCVSLFRNWAAIWNEGNVSTLILPSLLLHLFFSMHLIER